MRLKLELDEETTARLVEQAAAGKRPIAWQAEITLRKALGLPFPSPGQTRKDVGKKDVLGAAQ